VVYILVKLDREKSCKSQGISILETAEHPESWQLLIVEIKK